MAPISILDPEPGLPRPPILARIRESVIGDDVSADLERFRRFDLPAASLR